MENKIVIKKCKYSHSSYDEVGYSEIELIKGVGIEEYDKLYSDCSISYGEEFEHMEKGDEFYVIGDSKSGDTGITQEESQLELAKE